LAVSAEKASFDEGVYFSFIFRSFPEVQEKRLGAASG
jgi:hypothetical protein